MLRSRFIGDRAFYKKLLAVMTPVLIQNVITNFVSLLDNVMVGQVGTEPMSGVAIVNQLLFVFNLCIFGAEAGAGIFTAQYMGKADHDGVRQTFRVKLWAGVAVSAIFITVFLCAGERLIGLFLHEGEDSLDLAATMGYAKDYLAVMLFQIVPFMLQQMYGGTLRECGETVLPMKAGIAAVFVNMILNYILIFGKLGIPAMGVTGAAIATVIARLTELAIVVLWTHRHGRDYPFIRGAYRSLRVKKEILRRIAVTGSPLLWNELLWSAGTTLLNQCYSIRGLEVVSAFNISSTVSNLFFCAIFSMGTTVSILVGQLLGAGKIEQAVDEDRKLIAFSVALCTVVGGALAVLSPLIPRLYNTTETVRHLATRLLWVSAAMMIPNAMLNTCYFTLRSGGKTVIAFLFDSVFIWSLSVPTAFVISRYTAVPILPMFIIVQSLELVKCAFGLYLVKKRKWVNNLVEKG